MRLHRNLGSKECQMARRNAGQADHRMLPSHYSEKPMPAFSKRPLCPQVIKVASPWVSSEDIPLLSAASNVLKRKVNKIWKFFWGFLLICLGEPENPNASNTWTCWHMHIQRQNRFSKILKGVISGLWNFYFLLNFLYSLDEHVALLLPEQD